MVVGRSGLSVWMVVGPLVGCSAAVDVPPCSSAPLLEVIHPDALENDLIDAAVEHAEARLHRFMSPLHGYAFEGRFESTSQGEVVSSTAALGLLRVEDPWVLLRLSDVVDAARLDLEYYGPTNPGRITPGARDVVCPENLPVPVPAKPFRLPSTVCEAVAFGSDTELSIDIVPVASDDIDWDDLLFLNALRLGDTPYNTGFESSRRAHTLVDQASYWSGTGDIRVYVDYEAHWEIERDCLASHAIVTIEILHAERCDISGHTHGRYDSGCNTIATVDGRPEWARGF